MNSTGTGDEIGGRRLPSRRRRFGVALVAAMAVVGTLGGGGGIDARAERAEVGAAVQAPPAGSSAAYQPVVPDRLLDTRGGVGAPAGTVAGGATVELVITGGRSAVPADASAVVLNVTAVNAAMAGFVTVWPCGTRHPDASNLNVVAGQTVPNLVIAKVGAAGKVCMFTSTPMHLVADINGFIPGATTSGAPDPVSSDVPTASSGTSLAGSGAPTTDVLPTGGEGFVIGPTMTSPPSPDIDRPSDEAAAEAVLDGVGTILPVHQSATSDHRLPIELLPGEPHYPIGSSGYATSVSPAVGRLIMWRNMNGTWTTSSCSGTVVSRTLVLTAAHCLRDQQGKFWDYYSFVPGLYGDSQPHGIWWAAGNKASYDTYYDQYLAKKNPAWGLFDYAFVSFGPAENTNKSIGDSTGWIPIYIGAASTTASKLTVGYPVEGFYDRNNSGWCSRTVNWCYPYLCSSSNGGVADFGNGWKSVGFGCNGNGGASGGGIFAQVAGTWYVVSNVSTGTYMLNANGTACAQRPCWYMRNTWGPEYRAGYLDVLFNFASTR